VEEYCCHGITIGGLEYFRDKGLIMDEINDDMSTSDVCHRLVKNDTTPLGWEYRWQCVNPDKGWYDCSYLEEATGTEVDSKHSPVGTKSFCSLMLESPETARYVGKPTVFLSHAWSYKFVDLVGALRSFVDAQEEDAEQIFFWYDCFVIDEHATQSLPQDWWSGTVGQCIEMIGHTVMLLAPWDDPIPLTRAWCLWELYCTVKTSTKFSVALGPAAEKAFKAELLDEASGCDVLNAFSKVNVKKSQAGNPDDLRMIMAAVEAAPGGCDRINQLATTELRKWMMARVQELREADGREENSFDEMAEIMDMLQFDGEGSEDGEADFFISPVDALEAQLFMADHDMQGMTLGDDETEAKPLTVYRQCHAAFITHLGPDHEQTLAVKARIECLEASIAEHGLRRLSEKLTRGPWDG